MCIRDREVTFPDKENFSSAVTFKPNKLQDNKVANKIKLIFFMFSPKKLMIDDFKLYRIYFQQIY